MTAALPPCAGLADALPFTADFALTVATSLAAILARHIERYEWISVTREGRPAAAVTAGEERDGEDRASLVNEYSMRADGAFDVVRLTKSAFSEAHRAGRLPPAPPRW